MSDCEVIIVNGAMADGKFFDSGCTRDSNRVTSDSVIDYVLASLSILRRLESLRISNLGYSDHNALTLGWYGKTATQKPKSVPVKSKPTGKFSSSPKGWCFLGSLPEEKKNDFVAQLAVDPRLGEIAAVCEGDDFTQASAEYSLRRLHELIREAWDACGLKVHIVSGKKPLASPRASRIAFLSHPGWTKSAAPFVQRCIGLGIARTKWPTMRRGVISKRCEMRK